MAELEEKPEIPAGPSENVDWIKDGVNAEDVQDAMQAAPLEGEEAIVETVKLLDLEGESRIDALRRKAQVARGGIQTPPDSLLA